jgi:hypothetical protein
LVADGELPVAIKDPINIDYGPWCTNGYPDRSNTIYTYVSDGTHYVLCSWMENSTDPNTLQYHDVASPWNETKFMHADYSFGDHTTVIAR